MVQGPSGWWTERALHLDFAERTCHHLPGLRGLPSYNKSSLGFETRTLFILPLKYETLEDCLTMNTTSLV